jgi:hypothetical protein
MATRDEQLLDVLRARGLRKRAGDAIADVSGAGRSVGGEVEKRARSVIADLRGLADEIEDRLTGGPTKRKAAAKKAATTRATNARKRSTTAKKGAATRAKKSTATKKTTAAKKTTATRTRAKAAAR